MINGFATPPTGFGPGSQPSDTVELDYLALPSGMRTYFPHLPEIEDVSGLQTGMALLEEISRACAHCAETGQHSSFDLSGLTRENRGLIAETMGHGEVSIKALGIPALAIQESVFAGVWVLSGEGVDRIEVGAVPAAALNRAFQVTRPAIGALAERNRGVVNAPAIAAELMDKSAACREDSMPHVINLSLLPHTEEDLAWLDVALGKGSVSILSRGYGNCRIEATGQDKVWRVQFFNSMDQLILDTFEVTAMPEVAIAAREDLTDSANRIVDVMEAIR